MPLPARRQFSGTVFLGDLSEKFFDDVKPVVIRIREKSKFQRRNFLCPLKPVLPLADNGEGREGYGKELASLQVSGVSKDFA